MRNTLSLPLPKPHPSKNVKIACILFGFPSFYCLSITFSVFSYNSVENKTTSTTENSKMQPSANLDLSKLLDSPTRKIIKQKIVFFLYSLFFF